ncbi:hypothetical protein ACFFSY_13230 [Paenibacillus aurantiacus]|uniref:Uncharacterized protein n=1 Tax=Paenibacillus aurantiacus TaxID=1936118 RepID=A0ABV5KRN8_9BACL
MADRKEDKSSTAAGLGTCTSCANVCAFFDKKVFGNRFQRETYGRKRFTDAVIIQHALVFGKTFARIVWAKNLGTFFEMLRFPLFFEENHNFA